MFYSTGSLKPISIFWNIEKQSAVIQKCKKGCKCCVHFPSKSEYTLFLELRHWITSNKHPINLEVHRMLVRSGVKWKVDFRLSSSDFNGQVLLASLCNACNFTTFVRLSELWIEYKGTQDKNFKHKMTMLGRYSPNTASSIVLISSHLQHFCFRSLDGVDQYKVIIPADVFNLKLLRLSKTVDYKREIPYN